MMRREDEKSEWEDSDKNDDVKSGVEDSDEMRTERISRT